MDNQPHEKIEFISEVTESTGDHHYADIKPVVKESINRTPLAVVSLILALPFPVTIVTLWATFNEIKGQGQSFSDVTMNAVLLLLFQFFVIPVLSFISVWAAIVVSSKSTGRDKKLAYGALSITIAGFILMAFFLQTTK